MVTKSAEQKVKNGDIVLTIGQSGIGLRNGIVVDDINPVEPFIEYLEFKWNVNAGYIKCIGIDQLRKKIISNTFVRIEKPWQAGTVVAFKKDSSYHHGLLINTSADKVLLCYFDFYDGKNKTIAMAKSDCVTIPAKQELKSGDNVQVPYFDVYVNGTITRIEKSKGRVWVEIISKGKKMEIGVPCIAVAKNIQL